MYPAHPIKSTYVHFTIRRIDPAHPLYGLSIPDRIPVMDLAAAYAWISLVRGQDLSGKVFENFQIERRAETVDRFMDRTIDGVDFSEDARDGTVEGLRIYNEQT